MSELANSFDYVDINEIDPNLSPVDPDFYTVKLMKGEKRDFVYKAGKNAGNAGQLISLVLVLTNSEKFSGRRIYATLFPSDFTFRALRRISDATGVQQEPGSPIEAWLEALSTVQPEFKVNIVYKKDRDGNVVAGPTGKPSDNDIDWRNVQPA